jgi:hypothetical protein
MVISTRGETMPTYTIHYMNHGQAVGRSVTDRPLDDVLASIRKRVTLRHADAAHVLNVNLELIAEIKNIRLSVSGSSRRLLIIDGTRAKP